MSKTHVHSLRKLEYEILQQGYSLAYKILNASDYGVASSRKRLIAVAAAPGRNLPDWPTPTHGGNGRPSLLTLGDVISDLQWINPTCKSASKRNAPTRIDHPEDVFQKVASHCTHCSSRKICGWDDALTLPKWDEPIPSAWHVLSDDLLLLLITNLTAIRTQPTDRWKCRHPSLFASLNYKTSL